jgi:hypothetical protein
MKKWIWLLLAVLVAFIERSFFTGAAQVVINATTYLLAN